MDVVGEVRSGGQTGVDVAALRAAKALGVRTGGVMPLGYMTLAGPKPEWAAEFGLVEDTKSDYSSRTRRNVRETDVTVRVARNFKTRGEVRTLQAIVDFQKVHCDVAVRRTPAGVFVAEGVHLTAALLRALAEVRERPLVVNFAGNSEYTAPGIEVFAQGVVYSLLVSLR